MAKEVLNVGTSPNDGTGDALRTGGEKIMNNLDEIYLAIGDGTNLSTIPKSNVNGVPGADAITNIISLTQAEYDAIQTKSPTTLYVII